MPEQLAIPARLQADGKLASVDQGSDREIAQRVLVVCRTPPGWLDGRPGFGLQEDTFRSSGADLAEVDRQLAALGPDVYYRIAEDTSLMDQGLDALDLQVGANG